MVEKVFVTLEEVYRNAKQLANTLSSTDRVYGVPRGGVPVAMLVAEMAGAWAPVTDPASADVIVDDIYDGGGTCGRYQSQYPHIPFTVLFDKRLPQYAGKWLVMPWEKGEEDHDTSAHDCITRLLQHLGEDPGRDGLRDTPARVVRAWSEWARGYGQDPASILKTFEDAGTDEMVIVHNIPVVSKCEHHLADIMGTAHVGYIPNGRIVGLSKLARLVDMYARRLQVQERLTTQIADALQEHLKPLGVGVLVRASHHCMATRGVAVHGSVTTTSAMRGALLAKPAARAEFLALCHAAEGR